MHRMSRRECLRLGVAAGAAMLVPGAPRAERDDAVKEIRNRMKLGLVTYNIAKDWDIPTIIDECKSIGIEGVELRTTHAHGVEPSLSKAEREEVRRKFEDSGIVLWGLGSTCEYHSDKPEAVEQNVEVTKEFVLLAEDLGAQGVKVRPNSLQASKGIAEDKTLEQIGLALRECGQFAEEHGVEIWLEVHGHETQHPPRIRTILDHCKHPSVGACWNSNPTDMKDDSVKEYFEFLRPHIKSCHINELWRSDYPWRELFSLLKESGYDRFTLAEIPDSPEPERLLRYYRALWLELTR